MAKSTKTYAIMESVGRELKENEPSIVGSTRRKFGANRAEKQRKAIMFSKSRKLGQIAKVTSDQKKLY